MAYHCVHFRPKPQDEICRFPRIISLITWCCVEEQETPCQLASALVGIGQRNLVEASRINSPSLYVHTYSYTAVVGCTTAKVANLLLTESKAR